MSVSGLSLTSTLNSSSLSSDLHYFEETTTPLNIRKQLSSTDKSEIVKGLKWTLAMISKGRDVSCFFSNVVKCVACREVEVKKVSKKMPAHTVR